MATQLSRYLQWLSPPNDAVTAFQAITRDVDLRVSAMEAKAFTFDEATNRLITRGLQILNDAVAPALQAIQDAQSLGFLSAPIQPGTAAVFLDEPGTTTVVVAADRRSIFTPPPWVTITREDNPTDYMIGRVLSWNATTGGLVLDVTTVHGTAGQYEDAWVNATPGSTLAAIEAYDGIAVMLEEIVARAEAATEAADVAADSAMTAGGAAGTATTAAGVSVAARDAAEGFAGAAEDFRDQAQAAATTLNLPSPMGQNGKVLASDGTSVIYSNAFAPTESPALTGAPTAPTAMAGTNSAQIATTAFVVAAIAAFVGSAPGALDTLEELAEALGDDPNFATTVLAAIAEKLATSALASQAQAEAGTDNATWMSPLRVQQQNAARASYQEFTSSGSYPKPSWAKFVFVEAHGGGASGGRGSDGGSGGGGGGYNCRIFRAADLSSSTTVTVGSGGAAKTSDGDGNDGGDTTFGSLLTAKGGKAGKTGANSVGGLGGGMETVLVYTSAVTSGGYQSGAGGPAYAPGNPIGGNSVKGGAGGGGATSSAAKNGGTSQDGGNGGAGRYNANAIAGTAPGGGGGGAAGAYNSGAGAAGRVRVWAW